MVCTTGVIQGPAAEGGAQSAAFLKGTPQDLLNTGGSIKPTSGSGAYPDPPAMPEGWRLRRNARFAKLPRHNPARRPDCGVVSEPIRRPQAEK
jgi:hypothetical protein